MLMERLLQRVPCAPARVSAPRGHPPERVLGVWNCAGARSTLPAS